MKNPGYYLPDNGQVCTYRMHLRPTDMVMQDEEIPSVSICVMEILEDNQY
jgi:hypothetical protein